MRKTATFFNLDTSVVAIFVGSLESKRLLLQYMDLLAHCKDDVGNIFLLSALHTVNTRCISGVSNVFSPTNCHEIILLLATTYMQETTGSKRQRNCVKGSVSPS